MLIYLNFNSFFPTTIGRVSVYQVPSHVCLFHLSVLRRPPKKLYNIFISVMNFVNTEDCRFEASQGCKVRPYLKQNKTL